MASPPSTPSPSDAPDEDEANAVDMPMTMAASVMLENLPKNTHDALETAGELCDANGKPKKVKVRLSPLPNTKALRAPVFGCGANQRFEFIVRFVRKKLQLKDHESVFCYVNSVFHPSLDENVGNLWRCFKTGDELVVSYSVTQAFG